MSGPSLTLTPTDNVATVDTPLASNAFQILWENYDGEDLVPGTGNTITMEVLLDGGTRIPFDVSPVAATENQIDVSNAAGGTSIRLEATGLTGNERIVVYVRGLY